MPNTGTDEKSVAHPPSTDESDVCDTALGALEPTISSRDDFDNPTRPKYNPPYIRGAYLTLEALPGAD